jgi:L-fuconolactonase
MDTHLHAASDDVAGYPRTPGDFGRAWWQRGGLDVASVLSTLHAAGIARGVIVQPVGLYGYDNRYVVDAVGRHPGQLSAVIAVDPAAPDAAGTIARLAASAAVVGVRLFAVGGADDWVATDRAGAAFEAARAGDLTVVLTVFGRHLGPLRPVIEAFGDVPVALDHCAFPTFAGSAVAEGDPLLDLAGLPNLFLKVSSHLLLDAERGGDPADLVDQLAAGFGADRLLWGSDYPQRTDDYTDLVAVAGRAGRRLTGPERARFMGGNAAALF